MKIEIKYLLYRTLCSHNNSHYFIDRIDYYSGSRRESLNKSLQQNTNKSTKLSLSSEPLNGKTAADSINQYANPSGIFSRGNSKKLVKIDNDVHEKGRKRASIDIKCDNRTTEVEDLKLNDLTHLNDEEMMMKTDEVKQDEQDLQLDDEVVEDSDVTIHSLLPVTTVSSAGDHIHPSVMFKIKPVKY